MSIASKMLGAWRYRAAMPHLMRHGELSWSQYGEDMLFMRLLKPTRSGTYVDVGANHPVDGSNTYRLYLHGWSGITIDPNPQFVGEYAKRRPRDIHVPKGISLGPSELAYYEFANSAYNTFSEERREWLLRDGETLLRTRKLECGPLSAIVEEFLGERQIDLLNVDCEGFDLDAIRSLDLQRHRPTVLIVEDYFMYGGLRERAPAAEFEAYLRANAYAPIAQAAWSSLWVANDWRELMRRSTAFDPARLDNGYLPGQ